MNQRNYKTTEEIQEEIKIEQNRLLLAFGVGLVYALPVSVAAGAIASLFTKSLENMVVTGGFCEAFSGMIIGAFINEKWTREYYIEESERKRIEYERKKAIRQDSKNPYKMLK